MMRDKCPTCGTAWPAKLKAFRRWVNVVSCATCAAELERRIAWIEGVNAQYLIEAEAQFVESEARRKSGLGPTAAEAMRDLWG